MKRLLKKWFYFSYRLLQRYRHTKESYITCAGNWDGAGAQAHAVMSTMLFAELYQLQYVHTPFQHIEHKPAGSINWENCWEAFFGFGEGQTYADTVANKVKETNFVKHPLFLWKNNFTLYTVRNCHECTDINVNEYVRLRGRLKDLFAKRHQSALQRGTAAVKRIAIHIRRGDVGKYSHAERFTPVSDLLPILNDVTGVLASKNDSYQIEIYSQGVEEDFGEFKGYHPHFFLNKDEQDTFLGLVTADVLIMAKSSFSYLAGFFSDGFVFYDDFWHPPMQGWTSFNEPGKLRRQRLETFFKEKLSDTERSLPQPLTLT